MDSSESMCGIYKANVVGVFEFSHFLLSKPLLSESCTIQHLQVR